MSAGARISNENLRGEEGRKRGGGREERAGERR